jgi:integrase
VRHEQVLEGLHEDDELARVIEHLPDYLVPLVRFAAITGWRKGECVALRWEWVNLKTQTITLPGSASKNGKARTIGLSGDLLPLIQAQERGRLVTRRDGTPIVASHVFHRQGHCIGDFKNAWRSALRAAGFSHVEKDPDTGEERVVFDKLFHDLRRTAVRNMINRGVPAITAMSISGHRTRSMFDRYGIQTTEDQKRAFEALAAR